MSKVQVLKDGSVVDVVDVVGLILLVVKAVSPNLSKLCYKRKSFSPRR